MAVRHFCLAIVICLYKDHYSAISYCDGNYRKSKAFRKPLYLLLCTIVRFQTSYVFDCRQLHDIRIGLIC